MSEEWKEVLDGFYEVSSLGRIRCKQARRGIAVGCMLTGSMSTRGYLRVHANGLGRDFYVHRLIAEAFLGPRPAQREVNHIDGNKLNNRLDNLEYTTRSGNNRHAYKLGLKKAKRGESNPHAKLTDKIVRQIRKLYAQGALLSALGVRFGVSYVTIGKIVRFEKWKHVT